MCSCSGLLGPLRGAVHGDVSPRRSPMDRRDSRRPRLTGSRGTCSGPPGVHSAPCPLSSQTSSRGQLRLSQACSRLGPASTLGEETKQVPTAHWTTGVKATGPRCSKDTWRQVAGVPGYRAPSIRAMAASRGRGTTQGKLFLREKLRKSLMRKQEGETRQAEGVAEGLTT